jgi:hypothetical protein
MVTDEGTACRRQAFNMMVWQPALKKAGIDKPTRADGMHALRHLYASVLLDAGRPIQALRCASTRISCPVVTTGLGRQWMVCLTPRRTSKAATRTAMMTTDGLDNS